MTELVREGLYFAQNNVVLAATEAREAEEDHVLALGHLAEAADALRHTLILVRTAAGKFHDARTHATRGNTYLDTGQYILKSTLEGSTNPTTQEIIACIDGLVEHMKTMRNGNDSAMQMFEAFGSKTVAMRGVLEEERSRLFDSPAELAEINERSVAFDSLMHTLLENL